jgi:hypothetical protein
VPQNCHSHIRVLFSFKKVVASIRRHGPVCVVKSAPSASSAGEWGSASGDFFFLPFCRKNFTNAPILKRFQKVDPELGAVDHGAELTHLGATHLGADVVGWTVHVVQRGG